MATLLAHVRGAVATLQGAGQTHATLSNPACLVFGLTGLTAVATFNGRDCVLVANDSVGIYCAHSPPAGDNPEGVIGGNTYTKTGALGFIAGTDLCYFRVDRKVTGVNPMKVLLPDDPAYDDAMLSLPVVWVVKRSNRIQLREVRNLSRQVQTRAGKSNAGACPRR